MNSGFWNNFELKFHFPYLNRSIFPSKELAPSVTESRPAYETVVNADLIKRNVSEVASDVPSIDFGNLCLENISETGTKSVKRNQSVSAVWTPIEKNVLGIVTNYSFPKDSIRIWILLLYHMFHQRPRSKEFLISMKGPWNFR